jgi:NAD-dependent dihydropyrimidine dehydrogenase PreA subunit
MRGFPAYKCGQCEINNQREGIGKMPHTIVTDVCEGVADCVNACPVACIHEGPGKNVKGTDWYWIDFATCIDCGICLQVCPVENAILAEERPELQKITG